MRLLCIIIFFLHASLFGCQNFDNLRKAGVILDTTVRYAQNPYQPMYAAATNALTIYFREYNKCCEPCRLWSDKIHYAHVMFLKIYIKEYVDRAPKF